MLVIGPTGGRNRHLLRIGVKLLDLGEQRPDELHRVIITLDEVGRCSTGHGEHYLGCLVAALDKKIIDRVRRTGLKRHPSHRQLRCLGPPIPSQHAGQVDRRDAMRERNPSTAGRVGTRTPLSLTGSLRADLGTRVLGSSSRRRRPVTFGPDHFVWCKELVHVLLIHTLCLQWPDDRPQRRQGLPVRQHHVDVAEPALKRSVVTY